MIEITPEEQEILGNLKGINLNYYYILLEWWYDKRIEFGRNNLILKEWESDNRLDYGRENLINRGII